MKHIKNFKDFLNEKSDQYTDIIELLEDHFGKLAKSEKDPWIPVKLLHNNGKYVAVLIAENNKTKSTVEFTISGNNIDVTRTSVTDDTDLYSTYKLVWEDNTNESMRPDHGNLDYWNDYADGEFEDNPEWITNSQKIEDLVDDMIDEWNSMADDDDNMVTDKIKKEVLKYAHEYFDKFKKINGNIIMAMIAQVG